MNELSPIFLNNLLPIFLAAGAGYALSRFTELDPRPLSRLALYIFSPCLIFTLITQSKLTNDDMLRMVASATAIVFIVGALALLLSKLFRFGRRITAAVLLTSMFMNAGNFGLPVVLFAFGEAALGHASLFFVTEAILVYTLGVVVASMGTVSSRQAFGNLFKIPNLYAVLLALAFSYTGMEVPIPLARTTKLLGDASIPTLLILLGLQFRSAGWSGKLVPLALTGTMRLAVSPLVAWLLSWSFGVGGVVRQATILQAAMPAAVLNIVLATEFDAEPSLVTAAVFLTTLLSPFTLTPILAYLGA